MGSPNVIMDFATTSTAKKIFQISHRPNLVQIDISISIRMFEIRSLRTSLPLSATMSAQKRRICTFCKVFEAPSFKLSSALRSSAVRHTSEVVGTFSENRVHLDILVSIWIAEIRPSGASLALRKRVSSPKCRFCTFHTTLELLVSKICSTLRITATRHTYWWLNVDFTVFCP